MSRNSFSIFKNAITQFDEIAYILREDLAAIILETLNQGWKEGPISFLNFISQLEREYGKNFPDWSKRFIAVAWQWLMSEGFLVSTPDQNSYSCGTVFLTKLGEANNSKELIQRYIQSKLLQAQYLHHRLQDLIPPLFISGDYETAIFKAFKEVEIATREACGFSKGVFGVELMRQAFKSKSSGPLTDSDEEPSEQESIGHLFAGAYGYFRNPVSHRNTDFNNPVEAAEIIMLASFLLRTIEKRNVNKDQKIMEYQTSSSD